MMYKPRTSILFPSTTLFRSDVFASFAGNSNYEAASDNSKNLVIDKAAATVVVTVGGPYIDDGTAQSITSAKVTGVGGANLGDATVVDKEGTTVVASSMHAGV